MADSLALKIPKKLKEEQDKGNLVVFVGAGVSQGSKLPDFRGLCDKIAKKLEKQTGYEIKRIDVTENPEDYLDLLERQKYDIRSIVLDVFSSQKAEPNSLHQLLVRLFASSEESKLITTNYDTLLQRAASKIGYELTPTYNPNSPSLSPFQGIYYAHGCVDCDRKNLVLTTTDFNDAYSGASYVGRVLNDMFHKHSVLFVGYRVADRYWEVLEKQWAKSKHKRYAIVPDSEVDEFKRDTIERITYSAGKSGDNHSELVQLMGDWVEEIQNKKPAIPLATAKSPVAISDEVSTTPEKVFAAVDYVERGERIKNIVADAPTRLEDSQVFLDLILDDVPSIRLFAHYTSSVDWFVWLFKTADLKVLFESSIALETPQRIVSEWVARNFVVQHSDEVFNVIQNHRQIINDDFWVLIAWQLTHGEPKPDAKVMSKWVHFLLQRVPAQAEWRNSLDFLLKTCTKVKATGAALAVLDYLLTPVARLEAKLGFLDEGKGKVKHEVGLRGDNYWVKEAWEEYFSKHLDIFWMTLEPILQKHLMAANQMNRDFDRAGEEWDPHSFNRSAIEPHEQDRLDYEIDRLIDPARDLLDHVFAENVEAGWRIAQAWYATGVPLLKRIAIHGIAKAEQIGPEEKINWLLKSGALDYTAYKTECFLLYKIAFPLVKEETQQRVIDRALKGYKRIEGADEEILKYEVYNTLHWLHSKAPDSIIAKNALDDYNKKTDNKWKPCEHPDHDTWISSVVTVTPRSPVNAAQLVADPPEKHLELFLTLERKSHWDEPGRDGLLMELQKAVTMSFDWSSQLADLLIDQKEWKVDVWRSIVDGWIDSSHSDSEWIRMFDLLSSTENLLETIDPIARLLSEGVKLADGGISLEVLGKAEAFTDKYWSSLVGLAREWEGERGWLDEAINRPAGDIAEFWVQALSKRTQAAGDDWNGLPGSYKQRLEPILLDKCYSAQLARVIFGSRLQFFYALDPGWTKDHLVPLFNWENDKQTAEQVWHGFIFWGAIPPPLHDDFRELLAQTVRRLKAEDEELKVSLYKFVLGLTWSHETDPDWRQWFYDIIKSLSEKDRGILGRQIRSELGAMQESTKTKFWNNWLRQYWTDRIQNTPVSLSEEEADQFIEWLPRLGPVFKEAVDLAVNTKGFVLYYCRVYSNLTKSELPKTHAVDVNRLLVYLLTETSGEFLHCDYVNQIYNTLCAGLSPTDLEPLLNQLIRLGCRME